MNLFAGALNGDFSDTDQVNQRAQNAKEARNFQKSLRKPPKGIYLNYDELVNLAEFDYNFTFDTLDKKLFSLKQEVLKSYWHFFDLTLAIISVYEIKGAGQQAIDLEDDWRASWRR